MTGSLGDLAFQVAGVTTDGFAGARFTNYTAGLTG